MYLVLLRHGQAQDLSETDCDESRELTEAGIRALKATLPAALRLLPAQGKITVWASPLVRAQQTAALALDALEDVWGKKRLTHRELLTCDALAEADSEDTFFELANCLKRCLAQEAETANADEIVGACGDEARTQALSCLEDEIIILVGHNPQMSLITQQLSGSSLHLKKGALACVHLDGPAARQFMDVADGEASAARLSDLGQLRWFVQGPIYKRWKTLIDLEDVLSKGFEKVEREYDRFLNAPTDVDAVHDLRVSIRTLRSLVSFVEPYQKEKQNRRMQQELRSLLGKLSKLREYDVLIEKTADVDIDLGHPIEGLLPPEKLDEQLERRRAHEQDEVTARLSQEGRQTLKALKREFKNISWRGEVEQRGLSMDNLELRFEGLAKDFFAEYRALDFSDVEKTHKVRKQAKRVRYIASKMKPLIGDNAETVTEMKAIQDRLGELCDARANAHILEGTLKDEAGLSDIARWQANNLLFKERNTETHLLEELQKGRGDVVGEDATVQNSHAGE